MIFHVGGGGGGRERRAKRREGERERESFSRKHDVASAELPIIPRACDEHNLVHRCRLQAASGEIEISKRIDWRYAGERGGFLPA